MGTLNLKPRDRGEVYDRLCILADKLLRKHSACATCPVSCDSSLFQHHYSKSWCCGGCPHLGPRGCTVQALGCKLHLCAAEKNRQTRRDPNRSLWNRIYKLQVIAHHYQVWLARASKEESLKHGDKDFWFVYSANRSAKVQCPCGDSFFKGGHCRNCGADKQRVEECKR